MKSQIGFLQTEVNGKVIDSSDRLNWLIWLVVMILLVFYWTIKDKTPEYELLVLLAVMAYAPKSVGKFAELKYGKPVDNPKPPPDPNQPVEERQP